ncbi:MAG TPA: class GN sortase [Thermoanaerobaculia bacterium]|nr:class GN sortase [Thermoanaerobaculia bacterium]
MKRGLTLALVLIGCASLAYGMYIPAKAELSQVLLRRAWERTLGGDAEAKPWPWADTTPVARMRIERTGSDFIVLEGANGRALAFAPAHLAHSALPGDRGNCVISAHRDTHFSALRDVQPGDLIHLQNRSGAWTSYRISESRVVDQEDLFVAAPTDAAALTLITCWPFDAVMPGGRERFVIRAWRDTIPAS